MKIFYLLSLMLSCTPGLAFAGLSDEMNPTHYFLVPQIGYHFGSSELAGTSAISHGPIAGLAFKIERDHYFFTPDVSLQVMLGLDKSPLTVFGLGAIAGGRIPFPDIDVFVGITYRSMMGYRVPGTVLARLGGAFNLNLSETQVWFEALLGQYSEKTLTKAINYPYLGIEGGVQFPFEI